MIIIEGASAVLMTVLSVALLVTLGLVGCAMGFAFGQGVYALLLLLVARRRSGAWIGWSTLGIAALCAGICLAAQVFALQRPSGAWAFIPALLTVVTAGGLSLRLLRRP
jgi:peptidoglycan biosynthesis protein MviN/MurJ (putative lipid II flippase)